MSPRVLRVIEASVIRGEGVEGNPVREVTQYWTLDGKGLLAERDPWLESQGERKVEP